MAITHSVGLNHKLPGRHLGDVGCQVDADVRPDGGVVHIVQVPEAVRRERGRSQMQGGKKLDFGERDKCKPVLLRLSLAGHLVKPLMSLYGTEWRERGYEL